MTEQTFRKIVEQLKPAAEAHPHRYHAAVLALTLFGLTVPAVVLLAIAAVMVLLFLCACRYGFSSPIMPLAFLLPELLLAVIAALIAKSCWGRIPPPGEARLLPREAPELFRFLDELERKFPGVKIHEVQLSPDLNAGVVQRSFYGLPFTRKNYLLIGLPLMYALSVDQFQAVLAHELAHVSGNHGKLLAWIARNRRRWLERYDVRPKTGPFDLLWHGLLRWYVPFYAAVTYLYSRRHEFDADLVSVRICGRETVALLLVNLDVASRLLDLRFYPEIIARTVGDELPPGRIFTEMKEFLRRLPEFAEKTDILRNCLKDKTGVNDTHPCLRERLLAVCGPDGIPEDVAVGKGRFAFTLLGTREEYYATIFSKNWKADVIAFWRGRHEYAEEQRKILSALSEKAAKEPLADGERWELARAEFELAGTPGEKERVLRVFLSGQPDHAEALYLLGSHLLAHGNEAGIDALFDAMKHHSDYFLPSFEEIQDYLNSRGREDELTELRNRAREFYRELALADRERSCVGPKDILLPHGLDSEKLKEIQKILSRIHRITEAYLVRKEVKHIQDKPCYVLGIRVAWTLLSDADSDRFLCLELSRCLEHIIPVFSVKLGGGFSGQYRRMRKVGDSRIN